MLGVEGYGSDNDTDTETQTQQPAPRQTSSRPPPPSAKSSLSLPPPSAASTSKPSAGLSLPPPKQKKPKKIAIGLPALPAEDDRHDQDDDERPPAKKPRLEAGAGSSGLLSMLPAPKNKTPVLPAPERVLGGGRGPGLVFRTASDAQKARVEEAEDADEAEDASTNVPPTSSSIIEEAEEKKASSLPFLPPSLVKGRANVSVEEKHTLPNAQPKAKPSAPAVDFFSLGSANSSPTPPRPAPSIPSSAPPTSASSSSTPSLPTVSSAPTIDDFTPPEPTPQDPYPGYYLLPSGAWAAYDPAYYQKFYTKWKKEYDAHVRALEKGGAQKGFEGVETEGAQEVNALAEMEKAKREIQEREEKKALTSGAGNAPAAPKMNIKGAALSGRARTRHQLTSLLTEAYQNREALEERIAQGRRNRKEAGNKYGF